MANIITQHFGFGVESALGTPVAATRFPPCEVNVDPTIGNYAPRMYRGTADGPYETAQGGKVVNWDMNIDCRANDLPMFYESLVGPSNPTVATFDTTGRRRTYATSSTGTRVGLSMEQNDSDTDWVMTSMYARDFSISGSETDAVKCNFKGIAVDLGTNGSPTSYVNEVYTPLMSWQRLLTIEAAGGTPGTTAVNGRLLSFAYTLTNNLGFVYAGNNTQLLSNVSYGEFASTLSMTMLMSADKYQYTNFVNGTHQVFQIELRGPIVTAAYQGVKIVVCGKILTWKQTPYKGLNAVTITIQPKVDTTTGYSSRVVFASLEAAV